jgi:hypothetical protein
LPFARRVTAWVWALTATSWGWILPRMRSHAVWLIFLYFVCAGCDRDHSRTIERARKAADSWTATLDTVVEQWASGRAPTVYVRLVAEAAERSLRDQAVGLKDVPPDDTGARQVRERVEVLRRRARIISASEGRGGGSGS